MAIESDFERYANVILDVMRLAGEVNINDDDEELVDYINSLREAILETYTGIVQVSFFVISSSFQHFDMPLLSLLFLHSASGTVDRQETGSDGTLFRSNCGVHW